MGVMKTLIKGGSMNLKKVGSIIIFFLNPIALFTFLVCLSEFIKIVNEEHRKETALEKMIYGNPKLRR